MTNANFFAALRDAFPLGMCKKCLTLPDGDLWTYDDIDAVSSKIADELLSLGAKPGDRIAVQVEKSPENVALYLGAVRAGLVYVPLNTAYTADEIAYFLQDAQPSVFVCAPEQHGLLADIATAAGVRHTLTLDAQGRGTLMERIDSVTKNDHIAQRDGNDLAVILYTSGTTGRSKGAMLTHDNLASNAKALNALWGFSSNDRLLHALPIFHIHGLFVALHTAMLSGCEILFLPKFDVTAVRHELKFATVMMGVPTFYTRLLADPEFNGEACPNVRLFISGSAPLTTETFDAFKARTGHAILERYGMSEAGMIASNPLDGERRAGTVGFALPGVSIRIAGDAPGEVEVKGPNIFSGYWNKPEKTREAFSPDGYFKTGDVGTLDDDGRLTLVGRDKDLIIAGGFNIYPIEIERTLDAVDGIAECAVIGAPHPDMGEGVIAVIVATDDPVGDLVLQNALSSLAKFKRPRKFFWVDELPRNTMGKVQKQLLRERYKSAFQTLC